MSKKLKKHAHTLHVLCKAKPSVVRVIVKEGNKDLVEALCECCLNVLYGNVPLSSSQKKKLTRYKHLMRKLAVKSATSVDQKKKLLQTGGFLHSLLYPSLKLLGPALGILLSK